VSCDKWFTASTSAIAWDDVRNDKNRRPRCWRVLQERQTICWLVCSNCAPNSLCTLEERQCTHNRPPLFFSPLPRAVVVLHIRQPFHRLLDKACSTSRSMLRLAPQIWQVGTGYKHNHPQHHRPACTMVKFRCAKTVDVVNDTALGLAALAFDKVACRCSLLCCLTASGTFPAIVGRRFASFLLVRRLVLVRAILPSPKKARHTPESSRAKGNQQKTSNRVHGRTAKQGVVLRVNQKEDYSVFSVLVERRLLDVVGAAAAQ